MNQYACEYEFDGFVQLGSVIRESLDAAGCDCGLPEHGSAPEDCDAAAF